MHQLLFPGWWFSFFGEAWAWWAFMVLAGLAVLPLCLRVFRGLADDGASLALAVGPVLLAAVTWVWALDGLAGEGGAAGFRLLLLLVAVAAASGGFLALRRGWVPGADPVAVYTPATVPAVLGILALPHGTLAAWLALVLLAATSAALWRGQNGLLLRRLRRNSGPLLLSFLLFTLGFFFFVNVRSYIPWVTFDVGLRGAEKWGNYTHLNGIMNQTALPPADNWFNGYPINYYYGGHFGVATLAKATGTDAARAFNLGLATVFALTLSTGFGLVLSLLHRVSPKVRLAPWLTWHRGTAWALLGAAAIGLFGNLDSWRQILTRDVDPGVRERYLEGRLGEVERWKLEHGMTASAAMAIAELGVATAPEFERPQEALAQIERVRNDSANVTGRLWELAAQLEHALVSEGHTAAERLVESNRRLLLEQLVLDGLQLEREVIGHLRGPDAMKGINRLRAVGDAHQEPDELLDRLRDRITERLDAALANPSLEALRERIATADPRLVEGTFGRPPQAILLELQPDRGYAEVAGNLARLMTSTDVFGEGGTPEQQDLLGLATDALRDMRFDVRELVYATVGRPPFVDRSPTPDAVRWTWDNLSTIDFWAPSRAIKGTPPGELREGTITEFPAFSALLGDLHPHHLVLPVTLLALAACVLLLRRMLRGVADETTYLRRAAVPLLAMAFLIGAAFPVNIWDAVVLAPLYGGVVLLSRRGVAPGIEWRWLGFAGWVVLVGWLVALVYNSVPGTTPLFQRFGFFLLGAATLAIGGYARRFGLGAGERNAQVATVIAGAFLLVMIGPFVAFGRGGPNPDPAWAVGVRDAAVFALVAAVAWAWTLRRPTRGGNWWYAAGGVYAAVGIVALLVATPFRMYFETPLVPEGRLLADVLPPIMAPELRDAARTGFWDAFWKASPVNPFAENLRTELRDFFLHWGLFLVPILVYTVRLLPGAYRGTPSGFPFMLLMISVGVMALARNSLGFWVGALALAVGIQTAFLAVRRARETDGPVWIFLTTAAFWFWFVEALHFDDSYAGIYERYNTPFKIYYPLWPMMAAGMVVSLRGLLARRPYVYTAEGLLRAPGFWALLLLLGGAVPFFLMEWLPPLLVEVAFFGFWLAVLAAVLILVGAVAGGRETVWSRFVSELVGRVAANPGALAVSLAVLVLGMHYFVAGTMTRTLGLGTWPLSTTPEANAPHREIYARRTLDALAHRTAFAHRRADHAAAEWIRGNVPPGTKILERAGQHAYTHEGRIATTTGRPTVLGWSHHEYQWRGWGKPLPQRLREDFLYRFDNLPAIERLFEPVLGTLDDIPDDTEFLLYRGTPRERRGLLLRLFPELTLEQVLRLEFLLERGNMKMTDLGAMMQEDVETTYTSDDREDVARLVEEYGIELVYLGGLEREAYGPEAGRRLEEWGFDVVYTNDETPATLILAVPEAFGETPE